MRDEKVKELIEEKKDKQLYEMSLGEYFCHFYVQETSGLFLEDLADLIIEVTAFGEKKYSKIVKDQGPGSKCYFGSHLFFHKNFEMREELENTTFKIRVMDHRGMLKQDMIGALTGNMMQIYSNENHTILNEWGILTNPKKDYKKVMGFIKYSVSFTQSSDARSNLEETSQKEQKKASTQINIPPNIQLEKRQIIIKIFKGDRVIDMDQKKSADPYVKFYFGEIKVKSKTVQNSLSPTFNQIMYIPMIYPSIQENIRMSFKDYDSIGKNDFIGSYYFNLKDIEDGHYQDPHWTYFYGAQPETKNREIAKKMDQFPEIASTFKGALLLSLEMKKTEEPSFLVQDFQQKEELNLKEIKFKIRFDLEYVQNFFNKQGKFKVTLNWGNKVVSSREITTQKNVMLIFQRLEMEQDFQISLTKINKRDILGQIPDIVLTINKEGNHYSFYRFKCKDYSIIRNNYEKSMVIQLKADNSVSDLDQFKAGMIKLKCVIGEKRDLDNLNDQIWSQTTQRPSFEKVRIICRGFQAKNLIASDKSGTSDPFIKYYHLGSSIRASTFPKTLDPSWNEQVVLETFMVNGSIPPIVISVWDQDKKYFGGDEQEFMGFTNIILNPSQIVQNEEELIDYPNPKWYPLHFTRFEKAGKILLGFQIVRQQFFEKTNQMDIMSKIVPINMKQTNFFIKICMLGFRDLKSTGIFPVRKVKVKINTSSVRDIQKMKQGAAFTDLVTSSKTSGSNPTIGSIMNIQARMSENFNNMPTLSSQVIDQGIGFFSSNNQIGSFPISLGVYSYLSQMLLLQKLRILFKKEEELLSLHPDSEKHLKNFQILIQMIRKIESQSTSDTSLINTAQERFSNLINVTNQDLAITKSEIEKGSGLKEEDKGMGIEIIINNDRQEEETLDLKEENLEIKEMQVLEQNEIFININTGEDNNQEQDREFKEEVLKVNENVKQIQDKVKEKFDEVLNEENIAIIIRPTFEELQMGSQKGLVEENLPDPSKYYSLGFKSKKRNTKHYRYQINEELEKSRFMGEEMFTSIDIHRGKRLPMKKMGFIERLLFKNQNNYQKTGVFKGNVEVISEETLKNLSSLEISEEDRKTLELPKNIEDWKYSSVDEQMLRTVNCLVRLYIIDAQYYENLDYMSENDSYVRLLIGEKEILGKKKYKDQNYPKIFKCFEFEHEFPGPSNLHVQFFDHDPFKRDELIGETVIDVERRFFDKSWRKHKENPIEKRLLYIPSLQRSRGYVRCWLDIFPVEEKKKKWDISPRPKTKLELRVVVWEVHDLPSQDFEDVSDIFVEVSLPSLGLSSKTDTHYRAPNGFGSFNWRNKFILDVDEYFDPNNYNLQFKIFDKDLFSSNDFASDCSIDVYPLIQDVLQNEERKRFNPYGENNKLKFELGTVTTSEKKENPAKLVLSIECLTLEESKVSPVGIGRSDPNQDPHLPEPIGRFQWSLNPIKLLGQLVGPAFKRKLCFFIFIILFLALLIFFLPCLITSVIANMIIQFQKLKSGILIALYKLVKLKNT